MGEGIFKGSIVRVINPLFKSKKDLLYLGFVFPQVWINFITTFLQDSAPLSTEITYFSRGGFALLVALILIVRKPSSDKTFSSLTWPFVSLAIIAPFLTTFNPFGYSQVAIVIGTIFAGIGVTWEYLLYFHVYSKLDAKQIIGYILLSYSLAAIVRIPMNMLSSEASILASAVVLIAGAVLAQKALEHARKNPYSPEVSSSAYGNFKKFIPVVVEMIIYGVIIGLLRYMSEESWSDGAAWFINQVLRIIVPLILLWWFLLLKRSINISNLLQIALLIVVTALLVISFFDDPASPPANVASITAKTVITILLWIALALIAQQSKLHPYIVFGVGWGLFRISIAFGMVLTEAIGNTTVFTDTLALNLVYLVVISTVFVLVLRNEERGNLAGNKKNKVKENLDFLDSRCEEIGKANNLTKREIEVMQYICKGRSKSYIAKALSISEHTVRGYSKTLYAKLNVHSIQEILSLVGIN